MVRVWELIGRIVNNYRTVLIPTSSSKVKCQLAYNVNHTCNSREEKIFKLAYRQMSKVCMGKQIKTVLLPDPKYSYYLSLISHRE